MISNRQADVGGGVLIWLCIVDRQIPSVLSYIGSEEYHGAQAKTHLVRNAKNTVCYFRDFIGKR